MLTENRYYSYNQGLLPDGCTYCVRGEKLVLFVTGLCPRSCYFCPISDKKYGHDVIYANERKAASTEDIITESRLMQAKGAGITGGDPLMKLERTLKHILELKKTFGPSFHLHLYTSLNFVTEKTLKRLFEAGLDEIRFHFDFDEERFWKNITLAKKFSWKVGAEIPCIPTKVEEMKKVADVIAGYVDFLNLNELERADNEHSHLDEMGFKTIHQYSYATEGSVEAGLALAEYVKEKKYSYSVHLCTAKLKEKVQLRNRMKREAAMVKRSFDKVDDEGILTRGALYLPELAPGFKYREKLESADKEKMTATLQPLLEKIKKESALKDTDFCIDQEKPRILLSEFNARKFKRKFKTSGLLVAIVQEMPTADQLEIEVDFLD
ncbi:radical SAM protein [Candidatus Woesearchaeota archaeon]|nr:radical SAM protein [Candidatus Woesearchaeota archaeon]